MIIGARRIISRTTKNISVGSVIGKYCDKSGIMAFFFDYKCTCKVNVNVRDDKKKGFLFSGEDCQKGCYLWMRS